MKKEQFLKLEGNTIQFVKDIHYCNAQDFIDGYFDTPIINGEFAGPSPEERKVFVEEFKKLGLIDQEGAIQIPAGVDVVVSGILSTGQCDVTVGSVCFEFMACDFTLDEPQDEEETQIVVTGD